MFKVRCNLILQYNVIEDVKILFQKKHKMLHYVEMKFEQIFDLPFVPTEDTRFSLFKKTDDELINPKDYASFCFREYCPDDVLWDIYNEEFVVDMYASQDGGIHPSRYQPEVYALNSANIHDNIISVLNRNGWTFVSTEAKEAPEWFNKIFR